MSYRVFARKYRPQTFEQVVGQEHITRTLQNAISSDRLAQAYLFVGPRGIGKTSTARILAKALNCEKGPTIEPCGQCDACREIAEGNNLDVLEIDGASNNSVDSIRELRESAAYSPARGPYKIYLIDEVHMLSTAAFNALLKTLEEPPPHVKFIFATTEAHKVPATITSRCQRFDLRRIPAELIAAHLQAIATNERVDLDDRAAASIAKGADGGLRDAESMLDQLVAFCGEKISEEDVLTVFGFTARETVLDLCSRLFALDATGALALVAEQSEAGRDLGRLLGDVIVHLRDLLICKVQPSSDRLLVEQAEAVSREKLLTLLEHFGEVEGRLRWATDKRLYLDVAVIKAVHLLDETSLEDVLDTLVAIGGGEVPVRHPKVSQAIGGSPREPKPVVEQAKPIERRTVPLPQEPETPRAKTVVAAPTPVQSATVEPEPVEAPGEPEAPSGTASSVEPDSLFQEEATSESLPLPANEPAPGSTNRAAIWSEVVEALGKESVIRFGWLSRGVFVGVEGERLTVRYPASFEDNTLAFFWPEAQRQIETRLSERFGNRVRLICTFDARLEEVMEHEPVPEEMPAPPAEVVRTEAPPPVDPVAEFRNDPLIRKAIELFRAEIETAES